MHEKVFAQAWDDPANTRYEMRPIDVNAVLAERYEVSEPLVLTRTMLWDIEVRKARRPDIYIPRVVAEGSAQAWGGDDTYVRRSSQRLWLEPHRHGLIIEQTHLDHASQTVTFIGAASHPGPDGAPLRATTDQPLFHVEHAVGGTEDQPLNLWRTVHLTAEPDQRIVDVFARIDEDPWLPIFVEIYVRDVLRIGLTRR
ncbi:hypothetical protein [Fodinicola acaciae]|uniref:hypothetical protein n=1 Tax=Fodinicola acaciae TaxID=2681555 RepID=UPI0013D4E80A|nr:hypothetical protein [Fodinicola acaciae]